MQQANIKVNGKKLKAIPLKSGTKEDCALSSYLFSVVLKILAKAIHLQFFIGLPSQLSWASCVPWTTGYTHTCPFLF